MLKKRRAPLLPLPLDPPFPLLGALFWLYYVSLGFAAVEQFNSFMKCHNSLLLHLATPPKTRLHCSLLHVVAASIATWFLYSCS